MEVENFFFRYILKVLETLIREELRSKSKAKKQKDNSRLHKLKEPTTSN